MMMTHTGNTSSLQCQKVGRRKGTKEVVVMDVGLLSDFSLTCLICE
jgi:hypothetical protein